MAQDDSKKVFDETFKKYRNYFVIAVLVIVLLPLIFTDLAWCKRFDFTTTGQIGDTIGGTMGPFVAIVAAAVTFLAFWVQYKANQAQTKQFEDQAKDLAVERFESKFYQLLSIHRDNVNEIKVGNKISGRLAFIEMFYEFRFCYAIIKKILESENPHELGFKKEDENKILNLAYFVFFNGTGRNSDKLILKSLEVNIPEDTLINIVAKIEKDYKSKSTINLGMGSTKRFIPFKINLINNPNTLEFTPRYNPINGHLSRLPHYFRHLFHIVKMIDKEEGLNDNQKRDYAKTLRAQISDYEQLLLYYNICSSLGEDWIDPKNNLIKKYCLLKNIPVAMADFGVKPADKFKEEIVYWKDKGESFINGIS